MITTSRLAGLLWLTFLPLAAIAQTPPLKGRVVEIYSGDSLAIEDAQGRKHGVRLHAVAAPESRQPRATESRRFLVELLQGRQVVVEAKREDGFGRVIGKLLTAPAHCATCPPSRDAGLALLEAGLAWWHRDERKEQTLHDQGYYEYAEFDARNKRLGIWQDEAPVPPWEWRKGRGKALQSHRFPEMMSPLRPGPQRALRFS